MWCQIGPILKQKTEESIIITPLLPVIRGRFNV